MYIYHINNHYNILIIQSENEEIIFFVEILKKSKNKTVVRETSIRLHYII
jgi:hypothetical protein